MLRRCRMSQRSRAVCQSRKQRNIHRALVAWNDSEAALQLQRLSGGLGYRVIGPAACRDEAERLISRSLPRPPAECALIICRASGAGRPRRPAGQRGSAVGLAGAGSQRAPARSAATSLSSTARSTALPLPRPSRTQRLVASGAAAIRLRRCRPLGHVSFYRCDRLCGPLFSCR